MRIEKDIKFYDLSALKLLGSEKIKEIDEDFLVGTGSVNYFYNTHKGVYEAIVSNEHSELILNDGKYLQIQDELPAMCEILQDLHCAVQANNKEDYIDRVVYVTADRLVSIIANQYFGDGMIELLAPQKDNYTGFMEIAASQSEELYGLDMEAARRKYNCLTNQYIVVKDENNTILDVRCWDGKKFRYLTDKSIESKFFGEFKPRDVFQKMAIDSLEHNQLTLLRGHSGTGKSQIALNFLMQELEQGQIDKIIIFSNPVATIGSAKLGFYPGDKNAKLLDSQIGNFLAAKFGSREAIGELLANETLVLLPFSDLRGIDTNGMKAGIYITEAQNLDITLLKLALQRIGDDCICVIDGDSDTQVDDNRFAGKNNGICRMSEVFRGKSLYGEVTLQNIYRSEICKIAEEL